MRITVSYVLFQWFT